MQLLSLPLVLRLVFPATLVTTGFVAHATALRGQEPITRVSVDSAGAQGGNVSQMPAFSADGRFVAFASFAPNLVAGDTNQRQDVFVHDRTTGATVRVSVSSAGVEGDRQSFFPALSGDGRYVVFESLADNLVAGDTNRDYDVFLHDRDPDGNGVFDEGNGTTERMSVDANGNEVDGSSGAASITVDGRYVGFTSWSASLVAGDNNGTSDVFVKDRSNGSVVRVSVASNGAEGDGPSRYSLFSADASCIAFTSSATNLDGTDFDGTDDVFVHDLATGVTTGISRDPNGNLAGGVYRPPCLSSDGSIVAFESFAPGIVAGDNNTYDDVFVFDRNTGVMTLESVNSAGVPSDSYSYEVSLTADGQVVAFTSIGGNLVPNDTNKTSDVFVRDRSAGTTIGISLDCVGRTDPTQDSLEPAISPDGQLVAFISAAPHLVDDDTNGVLDVFVRDLSVTERQASWNVYDAGFPGTLGIPSLSATADPEFGAHLKLDLTNSLGAPTLALGAIGPAKASIPTRAGGTLLVAPLLFVPLPIDAAGESFSISIPFERKLCGVSAFLQALELDPGASFGISFTPGLELVFGL